MEARAIAAVEAGQSRIAPDPLVAVLPALSALGAIASIAAVLWVGESGEGERFRPKRKASLILRDIEGDCLRLQEIFKRLQRSFALIGNDRSIVSAPYKFGLNPVKSGGEPLRVLQSVFDDVARVLPSASRNAFEVMCAVEDGLIDAPETVFYGFGEAQERLNRLLTERVSLRTAAEQGRDIAERLTGLVRELMRHLKE